jgi:hypothetical protein
MFTEETKYDIMKDDSCSLLIKHAIRAIQEKKRKEGKERNEGKTNNSSSSNSSSSNSCDELNTIYNNICIEHGSIHDEDTMSQRWSPPREHGLSNSIRIIPEYYIKSGESFINIDYYDIIVDDIRNMRKLNEYQMKYIKEDLDEERKNHLLDIFNNMLECVGSWF